ncbi:MAG: biopolymer transporter ExbD, partial [Prevotella sp.]|nr:biopolymer transporter ExbD [Prevotella sp.]
MFRRRRNREVPQLNTTSTADISFMLLIFFLVTSSMDSDKGLTSQLPPPEDTTEQQEQEVKKRNVLELRLDADDVLTCNGEAIG